MSEQRPKSVQVSGANRKILPGFVFNFGLSQNGIPNLARCQASIEEFAESIGSEIHARRRKSSATCCGRTGLVCPCARRGAIDAHRRVGTIEAAAVGIPGEPLADIDGCNCWKLAVIHE